MSFCIRVRSFWVLEATVWEYCSSNEFWQCMPSPSSQGWCRGFLTQAQQHTDTNQPNAHTHRCTQLSDFPLQVPNACWVTGGCHTWMFYTCRRPKELNKFHLRLWCLKEGRDREPFSGSLCVWACYVSIGNGRNVEKRSQAHLGEIRENYGALQYIKRTSK